MQASELVNRAYVLAGITARDLDTTSGSEGADGLFWLNQLLSELAISTRYIPYITHQNIVMVPQQEMYFVEDLERLDVLTFTQDNLRYQMRQDSEREYWGLPRVNNIFSLPFHYYSERVDGGTNIYVYFKPDKAYVLNVTGRFGLGTVTESTELDDTFASYFQSYLMYELAERLCDWFKISLPPATLQKLIYFRRVIMDLNPVDLSTSKTTFLGQPQVGNWAQINIGKGNSPP